jgi:hypothetical protein
MAYRRQRAEGLALVFQIVTTLLRHEDIQVLVKAYEE